MRKGQSIYEDTKKIRTLPLSGTPLPKGGGLMVRSTQLVKLGKTAWLRTPGAKTTLWGIGAGAALWGAAHLLKKYGKTKGTVSGGRPRFPVSTGPQDPGMPDKQLKITTPKPITSKEKSSVLGYQLDQNKPKKKKDTKVQPIIKDRYVLYGGVKVYPKGRQFRGY